MRKPKKSACSVFDFVCEFKHDYVCPPRMNHNRVMIKWRFFCKFKRQISNMFFFIQSFSCSNKLEYSLPVFLLFIWYFVKLNENVYVHLVCSHNRDTKNLNTWLFDFTSSMFNCHWQECNILDRYKSFQVCTENLKNFQLKKTT